MGNNSSRVVEGKEIEARVIWESTVVFDFDPECFVNRKIVQVFEPREEKHDIGPPKWCTVSLGKKSEGFGTVKKTMTLLKVGGE